MWVVDQSGQDKHSNRGELGAREKLDRALVAGLILEVVLDQADLPNSSQARRGLVKTRIQEYLVQHLAGRGSLDRFRALVQHLDGWFDFYYPLLVAEGRSLSAQPASTGYSAHEPQAAYHLMEPTNQVPEKKASDSPAPRHHACLDALLDNWLEAAGADIPHRSHRKLTPGKLRSFLRQSAGRWFRLRDFERYIQMDRKTAWDYLQQFLQTGLLCHNLKNSAAVRYCLAPCFLKVEADALRLALSLCLKLHPEVLVDKVSDFLIATGGEAFAVAEWEQDFQAPLLDELVACNIIRWQELPSGSRFFKLHHRWLQPKDQTGFPKDQTIPMYQY
jgi:hypothetical protein